MDHYRTLGVRHGHYKRTPFIFNLPSRIHMKQNNSFNRVPNGLFTACFDLHSVQ